MKISDPPDGKHAPMGLVRRPANLLARLFRLQGQLIIPYAALSFVLAAAGVFTVTRLVTSTFRERYINQVYEAARVATDAVVEQENANLENLRQVIFTEGMVDAVARRDAGVIETLVAPLAYNYDINMVIVLDNQGFEIIGLEKDAAAGNYIRTWGTDFTGRDFILQALSGSADDGGDKQVGLISTPAGPALLTAGPIYDPSSGGVIGAAVVGVRLSQLLNSMVLRSMAISDIIVLDAQRRILITTLAEPEGGFGSIEAFAQRLTETELKSVHPLTLYRRNYQATFTELTVRGRQFGWLGVLLPGDYVITAESTSRNALVAIFLIGILAIIVLGYALSQSISQPILQLRTLTQAVAGGDLNQEIGLNRGDEIGELAGAFDVMTLRLRERTAEAEQLFAEAVKRNRELAETNARLRSTQQQLIQSEKMAAIGQLAAGIVHDVKNPLTVIKGVSDLLLTEDDISAELRSEITLMRDSAVKADKIVTDLLKFSRQSKPDMGLHDLRETVETALRLTAFPIRKAHVQVEKNLPPEPLLMVYDDQQIEQVLVNIIANALQAMKAGGSLQVQLDRCNGTAVLKLKDTGCGIPQDHLSRIFDPFFTTKPEGEGTGLGLSVSYGIISNHQGRIEVESTPGSGSTFTVLLPFKYSEAAG